MIGASIITQITTINIYTRLWVNEGKLHASAPGGLTTEQRELLRAHKDDIVRELTTEPPPGECIRGHPIQWKVSLYGVWLCKCYYQPPATEPIKHRTAEPATASPLRNYWHTDTPITRG